MSVNTSALVTRKKFGDALKAARLTAVTANGEPVTQAMLAAALGRGSRDRYSRLERGVAFPTPDEWRVIQRILNLDPATSARMEAYMETGRAVSGSQWKEFQDDVHKSLLQVAAYEEAASSITSLATNVLPALLQTEDYARAVTASAAQGVLAPADVERSVQLRLRRRQLLKRVDPPAFEFIFSEAALRQQVGGEAVIGQQLDQLIEDGEASHIALRVVAFRAKVAPAHTVHYFEFDGAEDGKPLLASDSMTEMRFVEKPKEVKEARLYLQQMQRLALSHEESVQLIKSIREQ